MNTLFIAWVHSRLLVADFSLCASSHLVIPEQQRMEGVRQVEGQRRGGGDRAGVDQPATGLRHGLAQLPEEDFGAGQQQRGKPHEQQLQQHRGAALHRPSLWLGWRGGSVEAIDAQSTQSERGDTQRHNLWRRESEPVSVISYSMSSETLSPFFK